MAMNNPNRQDSDNNQFSQRSVDQALDFLMDLRGCTERGKTAERKKQEEETGKEEPPKEMQYEQIQYKSSDLSIRCNRPRMGDLGTLDTCCQARGTVTGD